MEWLKGQEGEEESEQFIGCFLAGCNCNVDVALCVGQSADVWPSVDSISCVLYTLLWCAGGLLWAGHAVLA